MRTNATIVYTMHVQRVVWAGDSAPSAAGRRDGVDDRRTRQETWPHEDPWCGAPLYHHSPTDPSYQGHHCVYPTSCTAWWILPRCKLFLFFILIVTSAHACVCSLD